MPALLGTAMVAALWLVLAVCIVRPANLAKVEPGYLMTVDADHYAEITLRAMEITHGEPSDFTVTILGTSGIRSFITHPDLIEQEVERTAGADVSTHYLAAKGMSVIEMAGVLDYIKDQCRGIVLIQLSPVALSETAAEQAQIAASPRLGLSSELYDAELERATGVAVTRTGPYFLDHWRFYAARMNGNVIRHVLRGPPQTPLRHHSDGAPPTDVEWQILTRRERGELTTFQQENQRNMAIVDRAIDRVRQTRRVEVVLLRLPVAPRWVPHVRTKEEFAAFGKLMSEWAQRRGYRYWAINDEAKIDPEDFEDYVHLGDPDAQEQCTRIIATRLARLAVQMLKEAVKR